MTGKFVIVIAGIGEDRFRKPIMPRDVDSGLTRIKNTLKHVTILSGEGRHDDNGHPIEEQVRAFLFASEDEKTAREAAALIRDELKQVKVTLILNGVGDYV